MSTAKDMIKSSMRLLGVLASGETPSADMQADALSSLNRMIDSWSNESLLIYSDVKEAFTLVANQQSYTFGTGGDFNSARPMKIESVKFQTNDSPTFETPVEIINQDQWASISVKDATSSIPTRVWPQMTYPLVTMWFWPIPTAANTINVYSWKALTEFATVTTSLSMPLGYEDALIYNLAVRLAPEYGKTISSEVATIAAESKANIKRMNTKPLYLGTDPGVQQRSKPWNWLTGGF